jgi:hypothetical protein
LVGQVKRVRRHLHAILFGLSHGKMLSRQPLPSSRRNASSYA